MKILVCDDLPTTNREFVDSIERAEQPDIVIKRRCAENLRNELNNLIRSADEVLTGLQRPSNRHETAFDDMDLVVLDNNLAHLEIQGARLTAEAIAGYIRAFSSASYIVSINKNPDVDFDLCYLIGDCTTRADLALNLEHLSNPALWNHRRGDAIRGFLPWYWPALLDVGNDRNKKIEFVSDRLEKRVCEVFGITPRLFDFLPRQARALLSQAEEATNERSRQKDRPGLCATLLGVFMASNRSIPSKEERKNLVEMLSNDEFGIKAIISRVVAADLDFWFRHDVIGPQELLVDIPHLLMRMPFLLGENVSDIDCWNSATDSSQTDAPFGFDPKLFKDHLKDAVFEQSLWSPYPCFWWPTLRDNDALNALFSTDSSYWIDVVFCEDRSEFRPRYGPDGASQISEFLTQLEGSWSRRYVANISSFKYVPRTRFAH